MHQSAALTMMPEWCDKEKIGTVLSNFKNHSSLETNRGIFLKKAQRQNSYPSYKEAVKEASIELAATQKGHNNGKRGIGSHTIINYINKQYGLTGEYNKKLTHQTVENAVDSGRIGVSPLKNG